jgi:hypothetical protein
MNAVADYVPRRTHTNVNTKTFANKNNLNKYGVAYNRIGPNLTSYTNLSVAKKGYDPSPYMKNSKA